MPPSDASSPFQLGEVEVFERQQRHSFRLRAGDDLLLEGHDYPTAQAALVGAHRLLGGDLRYERCMTAEGAFYFTVSTQEGSPLARSPEYAAPRDRDRWHLRVRAQLRLGDRVPVLAHGELTDD